LDKEAKAEFDALRLKLKPDIDKNLELNKSDVVEVLSLELIKRYYFQKGEIEFSLRQDDDLNVAVNILNNKEFIAKILKL